MKREYMEANPDKPLISLGACHHLPNAAIESRSSAARALPPSAPARPSGLCEQKGALILGM